MMSRQFLRYFLLGLLTPITLLLSTASSAQNLDNSSFWLNLGGFSRHFEDNTRFNEINPALGFEYRISDEWAILGGRYKNSVNKKTRYLGAAYTPWSWHDFRFGLALGAADGYPALNRGRWFSMVTPVVMYENGRFGVNFIVIPTISESVKGALAIQFKFRLVEF
jgi:hypothetical protein